MSQTNKFTILRYKQVKINVFDAHMCPTAACVFFVMIREKRQLCQLMLASTIPNKHIQTLQYR